MSDDVCRALNAQLLEGAVLPTINRNMAGAGYDGTFLTWHVMDDNDGTTPVVSPIPVNGKHAYCVKGTFGVNVNVLLFTVVAQ